MVELDDSRLLDAVAAALETAPADDARAVIIREKGSISRFALNRLHQGVEREGCSLTFEVAVGKKLGLISVDAPAPEALPRLLGEAAAMARLLPDTEEFSGFFRPPPAPEFSDLPAATLAFDAPARAELLRPAFAAAEKLGFGYAGTLASHLSEVAVLTRGGGRRAGRRAAADARLFAVDGTVSGFAGQTTGDASRLDVPALVALSLERASRGRKPVKLPPGKYPVILMPHAVAELMEWFCSIAATARSVEEGMSVIAARAGQPLMSPAVTIRDDARDPAGLPLPFDFEGREREAVNLIERGIAGRTVNDSLSALRLKQPNTGHAGVPGGEGAHPMHLFMNAGEATETEMIAAVERGIYVTKFHYVNGFLDPHQAVMTGLTRDGAFLIENGKLGPGIENLRFTESMLKAFSGVKMISRERLTVPAWWSALGSFTMPALLLNEFTFTGSASDTAI
jgi:predicted Zn-dependent protease